MPSNSVLTRWEGHLLIMWRSLWHHSEWAGAQTGVALVVAKVEEEGGALEEVVVEVHHNQRGPNRLEGKAAQGI